VNGHGRVTTLLFGIAALAALLLSGCSPEIGFPAVHDVPAPRADTPLTPDQVQQATDDLISERNHLSTQTGPQANTAPNAAANAPAATVRKTSAPAPQPAAQGAGSNATQTAGADSKP
jgi:hypothetical protein